jgi:hypothetical protein
MEATQFGYSTKNIPIPSENDYKKARIEKAEHLWKRMRWKAHFFLTPENKHDRKETYGFNSKKSPSHIPELASFENRMHDMIQNVKFKDVKSDFRRKYHLIDVKNIRKNESLFVPADKTTNFYKMDRPSYNQLLQKNITKTYKKIFTQTVSSIENRSKSIANKLNTTAEREPF